MCLAETKSAVTGSFFAWKNKSTTNLEVKVVVHLDLEIKALKHRSQRVSVHVRSIPLFQAEPRVEVHVVEDDGNAAAGVVHVVHLRVALDGHPDDWSERGRSDRRGRSGARPERRPRIGVILTVTIFWVEDDKLITL